MVTQEQGINIHARYTQTHPEYLSNLSRSIRTRLNNIIEDIERLEGNVQFVIFKVSISDRSNYRTRQSRHLGTAKMAR